MTKKIVQLLFALSILFPLMYLILLSLGRNYPYPLLLPQSISLENWEFLQASDSKLFQSFFWSLGIALLVSAATTITAFFASKYISLSPYRNRFLLMAYVPYALAPVILVATLQYYFIWHGLSATVYGVLLAQFFITFPFGVIIFNNFWGAKLHAMEAVSLNLGGSLWQTLVKVMVPAMKNVMLLCFFQSFLISWFEFGLTRFIGIGKVQTLTVKVFGFVNEANTFYAALAGVLLILPPMVFIWFNKKFIFSTSASV